jgi:hypothetical protein
MTDLLIRIVEQPKPDGDPTAARTWKSQLWSGFPDSGGELLAGGADTFTQADLEAPLPNGPGDRDSILNKIRNQDNVDVSFRDIGLRLHDLLAKAGTAAEWRNRHAAAERTYLELPAFIEDWPWELLTVPNALGDPSPAFISPSHPVVRIPRTTQPADAWTESTVRILLVSGQEDLDLASPDDPANRASTELRRIRKLFQESNLSVVVDLCEAPTVDALKARIITMAPHIVHVIAHGDILPGIGFALEFRAAGTPVQRWDARQIQLFFTNLPVAKPRLFVLNSCNSARREASATPVTYSLLAAGVSAVIGSLAALQIDYARSFSNAFYGALAKRESLDQAMVSARDKMSGHAAYGGLDRRHWALPVLTARTPVQDILRFKLTTLEMKKCEIAQAVFRRPGAFVNRACDRWSMLETLQPNNVTAKRFRGLIVLGNSEVGKSWLVMRAMRDFMDAGTLVRFAKLVGPEPSRTSLDVLQEWRGRPNFQSPVLKPLPDSDTHFKAFDDALEEARKPGGFSASNVGEVLRTFKVGFQSYRKGRTVLLVLGRFRAQGQTNVGPPDFRENLLEKLLLPLRAGGNQDPDTDSLCCILIVRGQAGMQGYSDFDDFGLSRLSDEVSPEEQRKPQDGFKRLTLSEFARDEGDRHLDEYTQFKDDNEVFSSLRDTMKSMVKKGPPTWSPVQLTLFERAVDYFVQQP